MPQKRNPDAMELVRGKAARALGKLTGMLALMKGLPMAYDRDLQEDKAALFDGVDATRDSLNLAARVVSTLHIHPERMKAATARGFLTATDLADELVRRGIPFAVAHEQVGKLVRQCADRGKTFEELSVVEARACVPSWDAALQAIANSPEKSVDRKSVVGGTAPFQVTRQIRRAGITLVRLERSMKRRK